VIKIFCGVDRLCPADAAIIKPPAAILPITFLQAAIQPSMTAAPAAAFGPNLPICPETVPLAVQQTFRVAAAAAPAAISGG